MLNFNSPPTTSDVPQWKVLIYDQLGRDIISPLLTVKELRSLGVTLHLLLDSPREHIPDVAAVYFVYPSKENVQNICKDFESGRYESYYLNFISPISRESLEQIAQTALSEDCVQQIAKVFDQYTNFVCLEDDLLVLRPLLCNNLPSYYALNRANASDSDIEAIVDSTVDGLFSVFATLGTVPIIRCPKGDASEMIATRLDAKLRDSLRDSRSSLFVTSESARGYTASGAPGIGVGGMTRSSQNPGVTSTNPTFSNLFQRPLLVLLDRNLDLATPLHHELTYQSLVHDIFKITLNRIKVDLDLAKEVTSSDVDGLPAPKSKTNKRPGKLEQYELTTVTDRLWRDFKGAAFSEVAEAIRDEVTILRDYEKRMGELKSVMGLSDSFASLDESTLTLLDDNTARLTSAVSSLPQLMERKRCLDMHTNIATCLANVITQRQLHVFAEEEDKLLAKQTTVDLLENVFSLVFLFGMRLDELTVLSVYYLRSSLVTSFDTSIQDSSLSELIKNVAMGTPEDKLRLLLFAALLRSSNFVPGAVGSASGSGATGLGGSVSGGGSEFCLSDTELTQLKNLLKESCPDLDLSSVDYVQHLRRLPKLIQAGDQSGFGDLKSNSSRSMLNKLVSHGSAIFLTGMRHLIGRKSYLPFTRVVSQLMENKGGAEAEEYRYFDPKLYRRQGVDVPRCKQPFYEAYVFVVGGGSYVEYQNLLDWARSTTGGTSGSSAHLAGLVNGTVTSGPGSNIDSASGSTASSTTSGTNAKRIVYGCTELLNATDFLDQ
ncbi:Sec1 family protein, partial [Opisthorchis viverrini]